MRKFIVIAMLALGTVVGGVALGSTPKDEELVLGPYTYHLDAATGDYSCVDDPAFIFGLDPRFESMKEAGCRSVIVSRRNGGVYPISCTATECCKYIWVIGPNGWPIAVLDCEISGVRCPANVIGWPTPPAP